MPLIAATALAEGDYITNGTKLLRIERVTTVGADCEDVLDDTRLVSLVRSVVERDWQKVIQPVKRAKVAA